VNGLTTDAPGRGHSRPASEAEPAGPGSALVARGTEAPGRPGFIRRRALSLYWRVLVINAAILAAAALLLALTPFTIDYPIRLTHAVVLAGGVLLSVLANGLLLRFGLAPLERLKAAMREADVLRPGQRLSPASGVVELDEVVRTFNDMLSRLETERRASATRASFSEEEERRRLSRDLHDEIGQRLTAVLLYLKRMTATADDSTRAGLVEAQIEVRNALDEVRRVLLELRPQALELLGLVSALRELAAGVSRQTAVPIECRFGEPFPRLIPAEEVTVYRVAQEALTNVVRHAGASCAFISLNHTSQSLTLCVGDDGCGLGSAAEAGGIRGMRERAIQIGGVLSLDTSSLGGTQVRLAAPLVLAEADE
jgi:two-component system, NarL family, sensor histidine kinase UhpB